MFWGSPIYKPDQLCSYHNWLSDFTVLIITWWTLWLATSNFYRVKSVNKFVKTHIYTFTLYLQAMTSVPWLSCTAASTRSLINYNIDQTDVHTIPNDESGQWTGLLITNVPAASFIHVFDTSRMEFWFIFMSFFVTAQFIKCIKHKFIFKLILYLIYYNKFNSKQHVSRVSEAFFTHLITKTKRI